MSFLTINSIPLNVKADSVRVEDVEIGERGVSFDGTPVAAIRRLKRRWTLETEPLSQADAWWWRMLFSPHSATAGFEIDLYSDQGHVGTAAGGAEKSATQEKFGSYSLKCLTNSSSYCSWSFSGIKVATAYTVAAWVYVSSWAHYVVCGNGNKWVDGTANNAADTSWLVFSDPSLTLSADDGTKYFDDVLFVPALIPSAGPAALAARTAALPELPAVTVGGDIVVADTTCTGRVVGSTLWRGQIAGTFVSNAEVLRLELEES